jgi:hypothetical protein
LSDEQTTAPAVGQRFQLEDVSLEDPAPRFKYLVELSDGRKVDVVADCHGFDMQGGIRFGLAGRIVAAFAPGVWKIVQEELGEPNN